MTAPPLYCTEIALSVVVASKISLAGQIGPVTPSACGEFGSPRRAKAPRLAIIARDSANRPGRLADELTVNYRLGIFGFLNVPQLKSGTDAQEDSGSFALLDIIKALKFVRHDIAKFGGNPNNVTLMGQCGGDRAPAGLRSPALSCAAR